MPDPKRLESSLRRGCRQAGTGAVEGAITLSLLVHLYNVLTDSRALRDGQYLMFPIITAPFGAIIGAITGFFAGFLTSDEGKAPA